MRRTAKVGEEKHWVERKVIFYNGGWVGGGGKGEGFNEWGEGRISRGDKSMHFDFIILASLFILVSPFSNLYIV